MTKKVLFISDIHLGVRTNSIEWLDIQKEYFTDFLLPLMKGYDPKETILIIAGDIFDNRQSINLLVMNTALDIFQQLGSVLPTHIILGNHDLYRKSVTEVNSVKILSPLPGIHIYEQPEVITIGPKTFLMMPWRNGMEDEAQCINENDADYLVCHTDVKGLRFNRGAHVEHGNDIRIMDKFTRVFSGHIHYGQQLENMIMLGCPYPLTRGDIGNPKGVWELDLETDEMKFILNDLSPRFLRVSLDALLEKTESQALEIVRNNFVDITVRPELLMEHGFPINLLIDKLTTARRISIMVMDRESEGDEGTDVTTDALSNFNLLHFAESYIEGLSYDPKIKALLFKKVNELHLKAQGLLDQEDETQ